MNYTESTESSRNDDDAVSPVIGVILMVAITVILAAVIGTFVLGLGEQVEQNARAGVNADVDNTDDNITITLTTLDNSDYVVIRSPITDFSNLDTPDYTGSIPGGASADDAIYLDTTGSTVTLSGDGTSFSGTVTIVAVIGEAPSSSLNNGAVFEPASGDTVPDSATQTTVQRVDFDF
jgi:flagellin-like protein